MSRTIRRAPQGIVCKCDRCKNGRKHQSLRQAGEPTRHRITESRYKREDVLDSVKPFIHFMSFFDPK